MSLSELTGRQPCGAAKVIRVTSDQRKKSPPMSEQEIILPPQQPRRQDARDLQSRLYREIGLAAVEAALLLAEPEEAARPETRAERPLTTRFLNRNAA